jgi:hypothetical protein
MRLRSLCFLLALSTPAVAASEPGDPNPPPVANIYRETVEAWSKAHIDTDGWVLVGSTDKNRHAVAWYVAEQSAPGSKYPLVQEWVRGENASLPGSILTRWEIDCVEKRSREVERVFFERNNLHGRSKVLPEADGGKWTSLRANSIGDAVIRRVCRDAG